jgi:hypothetical protein
MAIACPSYGAGCKSNCRFFLAENCVTSKILTPTMGFMQPYLLLVSLLALGTSYPAQQQQPSPKGSIEGFVVRIGTGEPIAGARVVATRAFSGQLVPGTIAQAPTAEVQIIPADAR